MYLAIDIGGTKVLIVVFDEAGNILEQQKIETPKDYKQLISDIAEQVKILNMASFKAIAVGVPALLDRKNGTAIAFGTLPWENVPIKSDLEEALNQPILLENDSKLAGLSEASLIKKEYEGILYVTIGTGISSAYVVDGVLDQATINSESGQMSFEHDGKTQNWEDFASGSAFYKLFGVRVKDITNKQQLNVIAHNIAVGLVDLLPLFHPDVVVMGGGIGANLPKYKTKLLSELNKFKNPMFKIPPIIQAKRPEEAVVYGCYELAKQQIDEKASK